MPSEIELVEKSNGQAGSNSNGSQEQRANGVEFAHQDSSYGGVLSEELQVPITAYASNELASVSLASIRVTPPEGGVPENLAEDVENPDPAERNLMREDQVDGLQVDSVTGLPVKKSRLGTVFSKRFSMGPRRGSIGSASGRPQRTSSGTSSIAGASVIQAAKEALQQAADAVKATLGPPQVELQENQLIRHNPKTGQIYIVTLQVLDEDEDEAGGEEEEDPMAQRPSSEPLANSTSLQSTNSMAFRATASYRPTMSMNILRRQNSNQNVSASNQSTKTQLSFFCSREALVEEYGESVGQFATFQMYLVCVNVVLVLVSLVSFIPHAASTGPMLLKSGQGGWNAQTVDQLLDVLFLSSYQPSHDKYWEIMMGLSYTVAFTAGPLYFILCKFELIGKIPLEDKILIPAEYDLRLPKEKYKEMCGSTPKIVFQTLSYFLFFLCTALPLLVMWILLYNMISTLAEMNYQTWSVWDAQISQLSLAVAAGSSVTIANIAFFLIVGILTELEYHSTYTNFRRHRLFKLCFYRFVNTMGLFVWSYYAELPWNVCVTKRVAMQHLLFVLSDLVLNNIIQLIVPFVYAAICPSCPPCCYGGKGGCCGGLDDDCCAECCPCCCGKKPPPEGEGAEGGDRKSVV